MNVYRVVITNGTFTNERILVAAGTDKEAMEVFLNKYPEMRESNGNQYDVQLIGENLILPDDVKGVIRPQLVGPNVPKSFMTSSEEWDPEYWKRYGYERNWGDAAVMSPYFEVLRKDESDYTQKPFKQKAHFVILCPTFLRRPLTLGDGWGSY